MTKKLEYLVRTDERGKPTAERRITFCCAKAEASWKDGSLQPHQLKSGADRRGTLDKCPWCGAPASRKQGPDVTLPHETDRS